MLVVVVTCLWLALWQLQRLEQKTALIAQIDVAQSYPPRDLSSLTENELTQAEWQNVMVTGTFLHEHELHATPRYYKNKLGNAVLTPLAFSTPQGIRYVMVNRGWVPPEKKEASSRAAGNTNAPVRVSGAVRVSFSKKPFMPGNQPEKNVWLWYDLPAMAKVTGLPLLPLLIDATEIKAVDGSELKDAPLPFPIEIKIRNDHLGYAVTWFLLGMTALGVYLAHYIERKK